MKAWRKEKIQLHPQRNHCYLSSNVSWCVFCVHGQIKLNFFYLQLIIGIYLSTAFFWGKNQSSENKKSMILEKKAYLVTLQICGESQEKVNATESWIKDLILKEQLEHTVADEAIASFDETQIAILEDLQRRKQITIHLENKLSPPQIKISGISRDVYPVSLEVQGMIQQIKSTEEEQSKAELLYNLVEWRYPGSNNSFVAFDKLTNMQLEHAKLFKKPYLNVKINKKNYKVDLNTLKATDDQGKTINLQRVAKDEGKWHFCWIKKLE